MAFDTITKPAVVETPTHNLNGANGRDNRKKLPSAVFVILLSLAIAVVVVVVASIVVVVSRDVNINTIPCAVTTTAPSSSSRKKLFRVLQENNPSVATTTIALANVTTKTPTRKPTPAPSSSPTCAINLPNNFTALTVVNLQFQPPDEDENVNTTFVIEQLTELFQSTYNRINNVKYTPCYEAYRKVQRVKQIDVSEDDDGITTESDNGNGDADGDSNIAYIPASFVFRRQLSEGETIDQDARVTTTTTVEGQSSSKKIATHYVRIGRRSSDDKVSPPQGSGRRRIQEVEEGNENETYDNDSWIHVSLLFEVTVACRGMFCIGDNAELFGPVVINKNGFSRAYAENVARSLRWKSSPPENAILGTSTGTSNTNNSTSTGIVVDTVREIEEQSCPVGDQKVEFTKTVIVELVVPQEQPSNKEPFTDPDDPRFGAIEEAYVTTYNRLIRNEFCDPFFRRLIDAEVVAIGRSNANTNTNSTNDKTVLPLEMRITGKCKGCDPNAIDIYAVPSVLVGPTTSSSNARSLLASSIGSSNANDKWLLPSTTTTTESQGRSLQDVIDTNTNDDKCYCDAQPFGNRAPFESEFVSRFQRAVEALNLEDFSTANSCRFGTTFSTGLVMTFSKSEFQSLQDPNDQGTTKSILEDSLKNTLNELLGVTTDSCNKDFRVIENVTLVLGTNITRSYSNLPQLSSSTIKTPSSSAIPDPTTRKSENDDISMLRGDYHRSLRYGLFSTGWKKPIIRFEKRDFTSFSNLKSSNSNSTTNCIASNVLEIVECCEDEQHDTIILVNPSTDEKTTIQCNDATTNESSESPTHSPFDSTAVIERLGGGIPVLFFVSGVCSGCGDSLLTGLSNDVVRKLSTTASSASSPLSAPKFSRGLLEEEAEEERAKSDCFCPINATQTSGELEASILSKTYQENLERESVESEIEIIDEVDVVECEDVVQEFTTTATLTLTIGDLVDADVEMLEESFKDVYNYLSALYCDPYFREITDIDDYEVLRRKRKINRKSRRLDEDCADEIEIELYVRGTCLGCDHGQPLFDAGSRDYDRRRNLRSLFDSYKLSTFHNDGIRRNSRRRLEDSDVCFCEGDTFADRAPSFDEFIAIYEDEALSVPDVCEVIEIEVEEDEEYDDDGEFDDYYEEFFIDSFHETSTVDPDYFIDTEWPTDFPTESEDIESDTMEPIEDGNEETDSNENDEDDPENSNESNEELTLEPMEETEESTSQPTEEDEEEDPDEDNPDDIDESNQELALGSTEETEESTSQPEEDIDEDDSEEPYELDLEELDEEEEETEESTSPPIKEEEEEEEELDEEDFDQETSFPTEEESTWEE